MIKNVRNTLVATAIAAAFPVTALAATDGLLGSTSSGNLTITAQINDLLLITGLTDIDLTGGSPYIGTGDLTGFSNFCVYRNGTGNYSATLTGSGGLTAGFFIANGAGPGADEIPYTVTFTDGTNTYSSTTDFISGGSVGTLLAPLIGDGDEQDCFSSGGVNGTVTVDILEADVQAANPGTYQGILTILVSPL